MAAAKVVGAAATTKCYYRYWYYDWGNLGVVLAHTWMQLNWCGNGTKVTSYSVSNYGGNSQSGVVSYQGVVGKGALNVGWEVRQYVEFHFVGGVGSYGFPAYPCQQIRGGATGLYSQRDTCNLS